MYFENTPMKRNKIDIYTLAKGLNRYTTEDVIYSVEKLYEMKYIEIMDVIKDKEDYVIHCNIRTITAIGHEFLETIRPKSVWKETQDRLKKIGIMSLSALSFVSKTVTGEIISNPSFIEGIVEKIK